MSVIDDGDISWSRALAATTPFMIALAGAVLLALPVRLFEGFAPTPALPVLVVFHWALRDPDLMRSPGVFVVGMVQDLLTGGPLGVSAAGYLAALLMVRDQRRFFLGRDRVMMWLGAGLACAVCGFVVWAIMSVLSATVLPVGAIAAQMGVTALVYPLAAYVFERLRARTTYDE